MRGNELPLMTATPDVGSRLLALLRASSHVLCDRPSLPLVEQSLRQNRSQLMRMPQVHRADSYLSTDTIDLLRKEIGLQIPAAATTPLRCLITSVPTSRSSASVIRLPAAGWKSCAVIPVSKRSACTDQPPALDLPIPKLAARCLSQIGRGHRHRNPPRRPHRPQRVHRPRHGVVTGTAEIGNRCLLYQGVTLGALARSTANATPPWRRTWWGRRRQVLGAIRSAPTPASALARGGARCGERLHRCGHPRRVIHQSGVRINPWLTLHCRTLKPT